MTKKTAVPVPLPPGEYIATTEAVCEAILPSLRGRRRERALRVDLIIQTPSGPMPSTYFMRVSTKKRSAFVRDESCE